MFDRYLRDRATGSGPRWRRRLPLWLALAGAGFVMFVRPLVPLYVAALAFHLGGRSERLRAWLLAGGEVPRTMVTGYALLAVVLAIVVRTSLTASDTSDAAWRIMFLPTAWLLLLAPLLVASAVLPRHEQRERLLVGGLAAFVSSGVVVVFVLLVAALVVGAEDAGGQPFRAPLLVTAAISCALLLVMPLSVRRVASRAF